MSAKMIAKAGAHGPVVATVRPDRKESGKHSPRGNAPGEASPSSLAPTVAGAEAGSKFDDAHKRALQSAGLTDQQIFRLERSLPLIRYDLAKRPSTNDVRGHIDKLRETLKTAQRDVQKLADASRRQQPDSAMRAAFNLLGLAAATVDLEKALENFDPAAGATPAPLDIEVLVRLALAVCDKAIESEVPRHQTPRHSAKPAVHRIVQALQDPPDHESRESATRLMARAGRSNLTLVTELVFGLCGDAGRADYAIKQYRKDLLADR